MDGIRGVAIERHRGALPWRTSRGELVRAVGGQLGRAARTIGPVMLPLAALWIARRAGRPAPSDAVAPGRPSRGRRAAIVARWHEVTIYRASDYGGLERRSFGAARIDVER